MVEASTISRSDFVRIFDRLFLHLTCHCLALAEASPNPNLSSRRLNHQEMAKASHNYQLDFERIFHLFRLLCCSVASFMIDDQFFGDTFVAKENPSCIRWGRREL